MNNELRSLHLDEREEVERILKDMSVRLGRMKEELTAAQEILEEIDGCYARANTRIRLPPCARKRTKKA